MRHCLMLIALCACHEPEPEPPVDTPEGRGPHPWLVATPTDRDVVLARLDREPYLTAYAELLAQADADWQDRAEPAVWDDGAHGHDAEVTFANAFLAWLEQDEARALKAREGMARLQPDYETHQTVDINIRMPHTLLGYTDAWDFLQATPWFPDEEADALEAKLTEINGEFYDQYVLNDIYRGLWLGPSQNNHPIRTAAAIGYVALAFPEHPEADAWADWAVSELDYLWGPTGQYVQADGGVSEGPFYFGFAWGVATAFFIAAEHVVPPDTTFHRDCINRQDVDPWAGHGCVDGESFTFENPLRTQRYQDTVAWSMGLRLPSGHRPPLADAYFNPFNGGALLTSFGGGGHFAWDWATNVDRPYEMSHGADLAAHHLVYVDDTVAPVEPPWTSRFLPDAGNAVFRSDWGTDARWLLLVAEHGSARKTLHDHVDGTSFSLAAYGEYLLLDPGYYKPNELDNAVTAHDDAHNVVLIDGQAVAPDKGLLTNFGDADAFLENVVDGDGLEYAEARQAHDGQEVLRSVVMVDGRWFVVADQLAAAGDHEFRWRLGGNAGFTAGGTFALRSDGATWERPLAGVDVFLASTAPGLSVEEPPYTPGQRPHVHLFDLARTQGDHAVIDGVVTATDPSFLAVLAPYRVAAAPGSADGRLAVEAIPAPAGVAAWRVRGAASDDVVVQREAGGWLDLALPDGTIVGTDGALAVVALDGSRGLVARGTAVEVDGVAVVTGAGDVVVAE